MTENLNGFTKLQKQTVSYNIISGDKVYALFMLHAMKFGKLAVKGEQQPLEKHVTLCPTAASPTNPYRSKCLKVQFSGNDNIAALTTAHQPEDYTLRIDMEDSDGNWAYAKYENFYIDDASNKYQLHIGSYSGDAGWYYIHMSWLIPTLPCLQCS